MCKSNNLLGALATTTGTLRRARASALFVIVLTAAAISSSQSALAFSLGYTRGLNSGLERIQFDAPALAPFAYSRHCMQYPAECEVRGGELAPTERRRADVVAAKAEVDRSIKPE
jgi:hypothetical protein